jgi:hypothetical protein
MQTQKASRKKASIKMFLQDTSAPTAKRQDFQGFMLSKA